MNIFSISMSYVIYNFPLNLNTLASVQVYRYFLHPHISLSEPQSPSLENGANNISPETLTELFWLSNGIAHMILLGKL